MTKYKNIIIIAIPILIGIILISFFAKYMYSFNKENKIDIENINIKEKQEENINNEEQEIIVVVLNKRFEEEKRREQEEKQRINAQTNQQTIITTEQNIQKQLENTQEFYIKINIYANVVNIYRKDEQGNYTIPYKAMTCSARRKYSKRRNL